MIAHAKSETQGGDDAGMVRAARRRGGPGKRRPSRASTSDYPSKPVRLIVPFAPGGPADLIARIMAQKFTEDVRQAILRRDPGRRRRQHRYRRPGARAGRRLLAAGQQPGHRYQRAACTSRCPTIRSKDLVAITRIATTPNVLIVHPVGPGEDRQGAGRSDAGQSGQVSRLRPSGRRHAGEPVRRAVPAVAELNADLDPVRRRRSAGAVRARGHTPVAFASLPPAVVTSSPVESAGSP